MTADRPAPPSPLRQLPHTIWALGFVSMFMDASSEMIHALLPVYLVTALGASAVTVGLIEGIAEATASITKVLSGVLSDWTGRRKLLTVVGYGLAAATKPVFAIATSIAPLVGARVLDRLGKGIRGAPRDALIADVTPAALRGASFGLRQSLDTVGAVLGPLAAIALMAATGNAFRTVFWIAVIPATIAVVVLVFGVREPARHAGTTPRDVPRLADLRRLGSPFWAVVLVGAVLTLARFSEAFLILRAQGTGLQLALTPAVLVVMNVVYALAAYPAGVLADRFGRRVVVTTGIASLILADLVLAFGGTLPMTFAGVVLWGLHMGFTQGLFATLVADTAPAPLRGSAFGIFNLAIGGSLLAASVIAGGVWDAYGPASTFVVGAGFAGLSLVGVMLLGTPRGAGRPD